jgi:hypothetical protein
MHVQQIGPKRVSSTACTCGWDEGWPSMRAASILAHAVILAHVSCIVCKRIMHMRHTQNPAQAAWQLLPFVKFYTNTHAALCAALLLVLRTHRHPGRGPSKLAFTNCMGGWWGCIHPNTPSLLYHTGGGRMVSQSICGSCFCICQPLFRPRLSELLPMLHLPCCTQQGVFPWHVHATEVMTTAVKQATVPAVYSSPALCLIACPV